jgi:hypothetical protein
MRILRDRPSNDELRRVPLFDAFTWTVLAVTFAAMLIVGLMAVLRLATTCGPIERPRHFSPAATFERMADAS